MRAWSRGCDMILKIRVIATKHFSIKTLPLQNKRVSMDEIYSYILRRPQNFGKSSPYFDWHYIGQKEGEHFAKFCGLLRIYELYVSTFEFQILNFLGTAKKFQNKTNQIAIISFCQLLTQNH